MNFAYGFATDVCKERLPIFFNILCQFLFKILNRSRERGKCKKFLILLVPTSTGSVRSLACGRAIAS